MLDSRFRRGRVGAAGGISRGAARRALGLLALALAATGAEARRELRSGQEALVPCHLSDLAEQVLCGSLEVPEDRANPAGRRIRVRYAVLPALTSRPEPDPVFLLAGGPGQAATGLAPIAGGPFRRIRLTRDIVLVDLRGTGESNPLHCPEALRAAGGGLDFSRFLDPVACLRELDGDPRHYTSLPAMEDLDEVRAALGYRSINLWGGSYGTRAALVYMAVHPDRVRSAVLDGVAPFALLYPLHGARDAEASLRRLFEACSSDPACDAAHPDLARAFGNLLQRLGGPPETATIRDPRDGSERRIEITRATVASTVRGALYVPAHRALLPGAIRAAAAGRWEPLLALGSSVAAWSYETMSLGMTLSVLCSEDLNRIDPAGIDEAVRGTFVGRADVDLWRGACAAWPKGPVLDGLDEAYRSDIPALILSGGIDPITPPEWGDFVAERLGAARHLAVPFAAHNVSFSGCLPDRIAGFYEAGSARDLDLSCAAEVRTPPFVTGPFGAAP